ncbi:MAG: META domain-containing protein [Muribaculaceae bacterium]|nr:META domain-containing protein [Muribaculaceae bacterium]
MKSKYILGLALATVISLSGCSVFEGISGSSAKKVTATQPVQQEKKNTDKPQKPVAQKPKEEKKKPKKADKKKPETTQPIVKDSGNKTTETYTVTAKDYMKINGKWAIMSVLGEQIVGDEHPEIYFEAESHKFYGNNGCNTMNGTFTITGENKILLSDVITTMMLCPDAPFEYKINQALGQIAAYSLTTEQQDSYLSLQTVRGTTVMVLHRSDNDYMDGVWRVMSINGDRMAVDEEMNLVIDIPEGRLHGVMGGNVVNGKVLVDSEQANSIQFISLISSRQPTRYQSQETALMLALENVTSWSKDGNLHVILKDASGKEMLKLQRVDLNLLKR